MFIVIEEYIQRLSRMYDIIGVFNTEEEAHFLANKKMNCEGKSQHSYGYHYDCFVERFDTNIIIMQDTRLYIIIKSGIYTGGPTRQSLNDSCSTDRADYEYIIGIWDNEKDMKENYDRILEGDKCGFYFCFEYVKGEYCEQTNSF